MDTMTHIINSIAKKVQSGMSIKEVIYKIIRSMEEEFNHEVDLSYLHESFDELIKFSRDSYDCSSDDELEEAFLNTLNEFDIDMTNCILIDALKKLSKFDRLIKYDDKPYCIKLSFLLSEAEDYKTAIAKHKRLNLLRPIEGGIAVYSNSNISECINPRVNLLNDTSYLIGHDNISLVVSKNILNEFKSNAYEMDFAFSSFQLIPQERINTNLISEHKYNLLLNLRNFLNASTPLKKEDFYKSAQISFLSLYQKKSFVDMLIKLTKKVSQAKVIASINVIMEQYLQMPTSSLYNQCFNKEIQIKTHFFNLPIYEYRTDNNVKLNPIFENEQELKEISRIIS